MGAEEDGLFGCCRLEHRRERVGRSARVFWELLSLHFVRLFFPCLQNMVKACDEFTPINNSKLFQL